MTTDDDRECWMCRRRARRAAMWPLNGWDHLSYVCTTCVDVMRQHAAGEVASGDGDGDGDGDRYQVMQYVGDSHYAVMDMKHREPVRTFSSREDAHIYTVGANRVQHRLDQIYGRWVRAAL